MCSTKNEKILQDIWMAETQQEAHKAFGQFEIRYGAKYPKAVVCLIKGKMEKLSFYDFSTEHWTHIRTTNSIESMFATVSLRPNKTNNCGSRKTTLAMACKLMRTAKVNLCSLRGFKLLADIINGVKFRDGIHETNVNHQDTDLEVVNQI
ncbi:transposase [Candidatus Enterovibrio escicola]|uniref:transposase n=1 Tax=Candidatus Enterovibrio escicola TaxID=1927127 RepID=UPI0021DFDD31|nr:transposase [Candidatus Enterovibrio escacola]